MIPAVAVGIICNSSAKFHSDLIWSDGALGLFWRESLQQEEEQQEDE